MASPMSLHHAADGIRPDPPSAYPSYSATPSSSLSLTARWNHQQPSLHGYLSRDYPHGELDPSPSSSYAWHPPSHQQHNRQWSFDSYNDPQYTSSSPTTLSSAYYPSTSASLSHATGSHPHSAAAAVFPASSASSSSLATAVGSFSYARLSSSSLPFSTPSSSAQKLEQPSWQPPGKHLLPSNTNPNTRVEMEFHPEEMSPLTPISSPDSLHTIVPRHPVTAVLPPQRHTQQARVKQEQEEPEHTDGFVFETPGPPPSAIRITGDAASRVFGSEMPDDPFGASSAHGLHYVHNPHSLDMHGIHSINSTHAVNTMHGTQQHQQYSPMTVVPLRTQAGAEMKRMMGAFRLDPFTMQNGIGRGGGRKSKSLLLAENARKHAKNQKNVKNLGKKRGKKRKLEDAEEGEELGADAEDVDEEGEEEGTGKNWLGEDIGPLIGDMMLVEFEVGLVEPLLDPSLSSLSLPSFPNSHSHSSYDWLHPPSSLSDPYDQLGGIYGNERGRKGLGPGECSSMPFLSVLALSPRDYSLASAQQALVARHLAAGVGVGGLPPLPSMTPTTTGGVGVAGDPCDREETTRTRTAEELAAAGLRTEDSGMLFHPFHDPIDLDPAPHPHLNPNTSSAYHDPLPYGSEDSAYPAHSHSHSHSHSQSSASEEVSVAGSGSGSVVGSSLPSLSSSGSSLPSLTSSGSTTDSYSSPELSVLSSTGPSSTSPYFTPALPSFASSLSASNGYGNYTGNGYGGGGQGGIRIGIRGEEEFSLQGHGVLMDEPAAFDTVMTPVQGLQMQQQQQQMHGRGRDEYRSFGGFEELKGGGRTPRSHAFSSHSAADGTTPNSKLESTPRHKGEADFAPFRSPSPLPRSLYRSTSTSPFPLPLPPASVGAGAGAANHRDRETRVRTKSLVDHIRQSTFHPPKSRRGDEESAGVSGAGRGGRHPRAHPYAYHEERERDRQSQSQNQSQAASSSSSSSSSCRRESPPSQSQSHSYRPGTRTSLASSPTLPSPPPPPPPPPSSSIATASPPSHQDHLDYSDYSGYSGYSGHGNLPLTLRHRRQQGSGYAGVSEVIGAYREYGFGSG